MGTTCSRFFADAVDETHDEYTNMQAVTDAATVEMAPISSRSAEARILPASQRSTSSTKPSAASVKVRTKEEEAVATKIDQFSEMFKRLEEKEEDLLNNIHLKSKELDEIKAQITKQRDAINQKKLNMVVTHLLAKYKRVKNDLDIYQKQLTSVQHIIQTQHTMYVGAKFAQDISDIVGDLSHSAPDGKYFDNIAEKTAQHMDKFVDLSLDVEDALKVMQAATIGDTPESVLQTDEDLLRELLLDDLVVVTAQPGPAPQAPVTPMPQPVHPRPTPELDGVPARYLMPPPPKSTVPLQVEYPQPRVMTMNMG